MTATVAGHFGGTFGDSGFQVTYGGTAQASTWPTRRSTPTGFTALVNDIAKGGAPTNGGITVTTSTNHNPTITAPADKFIPMRTPFALTGSATDSDGDSLLYLWEQNDRGAASGTGLVNNSKTNGPLFRVFGKYADVTPAETLTYYSPGREPGRRRTRPGSSRTWTRSWPTTPTPRPAPVRPRRWRRRRCRRR